MTDHFQARISLHKANFRSNLMDQTENTCGPVFEKNWFNDEDQNTSHVLSTFFLLQIYSYFTKTIVEIKFFHFSCVLGNVRKIPDN